MTGKPQSSNTQPDKPEDISAVAAQQESAEIESPTVEPVSATEKPQLSDRDSFLVGTAAGGFFSLVFLGFSMEMAHMPLSEVSAVAWGAVIATTLLFGGLGVRFKDKFFDALASVLPVPF